jgi:RHS repeat-associated protein
LPALEYRSLTTLTRRTRWRKRVSVRRRASGRVHYNYFRDYDPAVGRYVQSDPLSVREHAQEAIFRARTYQSRPGNWSNFAYSLDNPLTYSDPTGLVPGGLPLTTGCKTSEWAHCTAKCAPYKALGCYVSVAWKIRGVRGGEPIREEVRTVNCNRGEPAEQFVCGTGCKTLIIGGIVVAGACIIASGGTASPAAGPATVGGLAVLGAAQ